MSEAQVDVNVMVEEVAIEVKNIIEALIFACDEPMTVRMIRGIIDEANKDRLPHEQLTVNAEIIRKAVSELNKGYGKLGSGFRIIEIAGGFVYATQEQFAAWVGRLAKERARRRLSPTAVETLAIIAYKQPITKTEVEFIRGVNVDYIINALLEKDLIHITGRQNSPGRPLLYGTTQKFLEHFGLNELTDLPKPREIAELISETEIEVDRRLLAEQQELEFRESLENKLEGHEGAAKKEKSPRRAKVKVPDEVKSERAEQERSEKTNGKAVAEEPSGNGGPIVAENDGSASGPASIDGTQEIPAVSEPEESAADSQPVEPLAAVEMPAATAFETPALEKQNDNPVVVEKMDIVESAPAVVNESMESEAGISSHEVPMEHEVPKPAMVFGEEGAILSTSSTHTDETINRPESERPGQPSPEHGWSKWKTKVKTFFKKLFG